MKQIIGKLLYYIFLGTGLTLLSHYILKISINANDIYFMMSLVIGISIVTIIDMIIMDRNKHSKAIKEVQKHKEKMKKLI